MKSILVALIIFLFPNFIFGQYNETIRSGRPGQAIGAYTLGEKIIQIQTGLTFNQIKSGIIKNKSVSENTVLRLGLFEKFELSGVLTWQCDELNSNGLSENRTGISNTQIGGRINILERKGAIPGIGFQGRLLLKAQNQDFKREKLGSRFILATDSKLTDWLSLTTNWGVTWEGNNSDPTSIYILNFSFGLSDKFGGFVEMYGDLNDISTNFDTGISYLVNSEMQLDLSGGWQGSEDISDWFVDFGVSYRFDWRN